MLAIAALSYVSKSYADAPPVLTLPNVSSKNLFPAIPAEKIIQKVRQSASAGEGTLLPMTPSGGVALTQSCVVPKGASVDDNQDVWTSSKKVERVSPCNDPKLLAPGGGWIVSATRTAGYYYFTEVYVQMIVPSADPSPSGRNAVFLWPGISDSYTGYLFQPVLQFNQHGVTHWQMQDYVVQGNVTVIHTDTPQNVNHGDQIHAVVMFDFQNPGPSCSPSGFPGKNCNYWMAWWDVTNGASGGFEYNSPAILNSADAAVLELNAPDTPSCQDFPSDSGAVFYQSLLYEWLPTSGFPGSSAQDMPPFTMTQYPYAGSGTLYDSTGHMLNCGTNGFQIGQGCWFGDCADFGWGYLTTY
ncbi:MAG: hypothetical protein ACRENE_20345 [Polyangiaceae bacterium]